MASHDITGEFRLKLTYVETRTSQETLKMKISTSTIYESDHATEKGLQAFVTEVGRSFKGKTKIEIQNHIKGLIQQCKNSTANKVKDAEEGTYSSTGACLIINIFCLCYLIFSSCFLCARVQICSQIFAHS